MAHFLSDGIGKYFNPHIFLVEIIVPIPTNPNLKK